MLQREQGSEQETIFLKSAEQTKIGP